MFMNSSDGQPTFNAHRVPFGRRLSFCREPSGSCGFVDTVQQATTALEVLRNEANKSFVMSNNSGTYTTENWQLVNSGRLAPRIATARDRGPGGWTLKSVTRHAKMSAENSVKSDRSVELSTRRLDSA